MVVYRAVIAFHVHRVLRFAECFCVYVCAVLSSTFVFVFCMEPNRSVVDLSLYGSWCFFMLLHAAHADLCLNCPKCVRMYMHLYSRAIVFDALRQLQLHKQRLQQLRERPRR